MSPEEMFKMRDELASFLASQKVEHGASSHKLAEALIAKGWHNRPSNQPAQVPAVGIPTWPPLDLRNLKPYCGDPPGICTSDTTSDI